VLTTRVDAVSWDGAVEQIQRWAHARESRAIYFCNVHAVVTACRDLELAAAFAAGDLLLPDGDPVAWTLRRAGYRGQTRISGPDLMPALLARAEGVGLSVYFYGDHPSTLQSLRQVLQRDLPALRVAGLHSPPFQDMTPEQDRQIVEQINASGANIVFVALGCPKQEKWIAAHRGRIAAPMLGVGAAFGFHAGAKRRAPRWVRRCGLEWLHRLASEPRRLFRRYAVTNTIFIWATFKSLFWRSASDLSRRR